MTLSPSDGVELINDTLGPLFEAERARLAIIDRWYRWDNEDVVLPRQATDEHKKLAALAKTPWAGLIVTNVAQGMRLDGFRDPTTPDTGTESDGVTSVSDRAWRRWTANGLDGRQSAIYRSTLAYGASYGTATDGVDPLTGEAMAVMRGVSPRKMLAYYQDPAEDDWPMYALRYDGHGRWRLYDAEAVYRFGVEDGPNGTKRLQFITYDRHSAGVCPVVRFCNMLDLDGRTDGEVEPFIPLFKRIDKTTYDRLLIQHFNSWKVRWATGLAKPDDDDAAALERLRLRHDDILINESTDGAFGTLPETTMDGVIKAGDSDVKTLAATSQTPTHALTGDLINLNADALAAARSELERKTGERKGSVGAGIAKWQRLGAHIEGDTEGAANVLLQPTWQDLSVRSMANAADALGKMATMLEIPVEALWSLVPGIDKTAVEEWRAMAKAAPDVPPAAA